MTDDNHQNSSGINRHFYRNLVMDLPQLFLAIVRFNTRVSQETSIKRLDSQKHDDLLKQVIKVSNRAGARILGSPDNGFWDFEDESRRLALLDAPVLKDLILSWGAAMCAPLINIIVRKEEVVILNRDVEGRFLDFARGKGRFVLGEISDIVRLEETDVMPDQIRPLMVKYGMYAHGICTTAWPESLKNLEDQKIENHLSDFLEYRVRLDQVNPSHLRAIWFSMKKILLKEVAPQWIPCFS